ncbi:glycerophosphodiester phosphodiesterase [Roseobacter sp.]|uniref:glycerophosphodiester phosphodiesterase n=1 Tax=Roseobacter sp. TaxID=1907202 RepID=UPI002967098F|nr:glycerophosphodiester phosphodiesterase family protein [Roseobacter sp.]MDW3182088.1 glycerophosphodiester phosphodiesterase family protein [Roseobacter sp.]
MKRMTYLGAAALCFAGLTATLGQAATVGSYNTLTGAAPLVIGHRGAPAYLPENSIGGNELAAKMGSDFIETDVMMTRDNVLIAMHDTTLERTTNVEEIYAPRNGGYAVSDFTYEELRALTVNPTGSGAETFPGFTPSADNPYRIPTFADMLDALTAYNDANGTSVGMLTEGKYSDNIDTSRAVIQTLIDKGYDTPEKSVVQSFDFNNVSDYAELLDAAGVEMGVAQLGVGWPLDDGTLGVLSIGGAFGTLTQLSQYTDTVALSFRTITKELIAAAHGEGLSVYGWTFRPDDQTEAFELAETFLDWGLDGFITDNPDYLRRVVDAYGDQVSPVPLPAGMPLLVVALLGLVGLRRRV